MMFKTVNIFPKFPIIGVNPPIRTAVRRVTKSTAEIRTCIIARAIVEEILEDGSTVILDLNNFDKDNSNTVAEEPIAEPEEPAPVQEEVSEPVEVSEPEPAANQYYSNNKKKNKKNKHNNNRNVVVEEPPVVNEEPIQESADEVIETMDVENL